MRVSVVLPNFNMGRYLGQAIDSIMAQTLQDFEVLVIDGGSTDDSISIVKAYDSRVRFLPFHERGFSKAINYGIDMATGEYVARLDADDICHALRFEKQVAALGSDTDAILCWTDAWRMNSRGEAVGGIWGCNYLTDEQLRSGSILEALLKRNVIIHGTVMLRRSSLGARRFDEAILYAEDWDMWARLSSTSRFVHVHEPLYGYRVHQGGSQGLRNMRNHILWRGIRVPRHWLDILPLTARQRGIVATTVATSPPLIVGSELLGNIRPDTMKKRFR